MIRSIKSWRQLLPAVAAICSLLAIWQIVGQQGLVSVRLLPEPTHIIQALVSQWAIIGDNTLQTVGETLLGLIIAMALGGFFGIAIFLSSQLRGALYPVLVTSQTVPTIALAPLLLIWFGFGLLPKVIMVVLYCFFPICVSVTDGLASTDHQLIELAASMRASTWQRLRYIQIPAAMPAFFSGLKISATYAMTGAIVGEYVGASRGLGIYMQSAAHSDAIDLVFAAILVIVIISLVLLLLVTWLEKRCLPWLER